MQSFPFGGIAPVPPTGTGIKRYQFFKQTKNFVFFVLSWQQLLSIDSVLRAQFSLNLKNGENGLAKQCSS